MNPDGQVESITTDALHLESGSHCFKELGDEEGGGGYCHLSSLAFITNTLHAYVRHYYLYSALFCALTITSVIYHSKLWDCNAVYIIDKIAIYCVVACGGYLFYNTLMELYTQSDVSLCNACISCFIASTFGAVLYLYYYGFKNNDYCFHQNINVSSYYHSILHAIGSIGHHFILILRGRLNIMPI